ncbi:BTAD domain-containing putative transcriptional regulator [Kribbella sp. NPDC056345]|uniref:AfsR/SARP family transcriptional regulator n=1 Tax=Kribbella sp. NPDC056345 TaxID=3345789 RepID=UPI0035DC20C3
MEIRLFGPVEVQVGLERLEIGSAKPRLVFAILAATPGTLVPVDVLMDRVWGQNPPGRATATLYPYLSMLRKALEPAGIGIVRRSGGYLCEAAANDVDVVRFRERLRVAKLSHRDAAIGLLSEALALWRGQPLAGLSGNWVDGFRAALGQERLAGWLGLARHREQAGTLDLIADELLALTADHPLSEPLAGYVLSALALAGRRAEALDHYAALRERLVDELGTEPGAELSERHTTLLRRAPARTSVQTREAAPAVLRQLPALGRSFVGRDEQVGRLDELADLVGTGDEGTTVVAAITGTGGIGKTTLAVHWAHRVAGRFPDGQLYLNLRGFDPVGAPLEPSQAVGDLLAALGASPHDIPAELPARAAMFRSLVAGRRLLILLDNARDTEQVRPMLPGAGHCMVVVTSRNALAGLVAERGADVICLGPLTVADARALLQARVSTDRLAAEPSAVAELLRPCGGLPLALAVVAARAALHPRQPLGELASQLASIHRRLDAFDTDDPRTTIRAVFNSSYNALEPEAQRTFCLLGLHPGPEISATAAASLTGNADVHVDLRQLVAAHLVTVDHGRYGMHDLVRAYACELSEADPERATATQRMLDHYLWSSYAGELLQSPHRTPPVAVPPPAQPGVRPDTVTDLDAAQAWFGTERPVLLRLIHLAAMTGLDSAAIQLSEMFRTFLLQHRLFDDWITIEHSALSAAERLCDRAAASTALRALGRAYAGLGQYAEATSHLDASLKIARADRDPLGEADCHRMMASLHDQQNDYATARCHARQAHELYAQLGNKPGQASALNEIGWFSAHLNDHVAATSACKAAIAIATEIGSYRREAAAWHSLGYAYRQTGNHQAAVDSYRHAVSAGQLASRGPVAASREAGDKHFVAEALTDLGDALRDSGDHIAARQAWCQALDILADLDSPAAAQARKALTERTAVHP